MHKLFGELSVSNGVMECLLLQWVLYFRRIQIRGAGSILVLT